MDINQIIQKRVSVRSYAEAVPTDIQLNEVLEAGRLAPSAVNRQPWIFYAVRSQSALEKLFEAYPRDWFRTAHCIIVVVANHNESWHRGNDGKDHADIDIAIATDHMTLKATSMGLSTCWVCNFESLKVSQALNLPDYLEPVVMLPIGVAAKVEEKVKMRKSLEEVSRFV